MGLNELVETGVIGIVVGVIYLLRQISALDHRQTARDAQLRIQLTALEGQLKAGISDLGDTVVSCMELMASFEKSRTREALETRRMILRSEPDEP